MGTIAERLGTLRSRGMSFRLLRHLLSEYEIPVAQGWTSLLAKHASDPQSAAEREAWVTAVHQIYCDQIFYGDKAAAVLAVEDPLHRAVIADAFASLVDGTSVFAHRFPLPIDEDDLKNASSIPLATQFDTLPGPILRVVFCAKRYVKSREELNLQDFDDDVRGALAGYEELVGIRAGYVQCFDVVRFDPQNGKLEIQVDASMPLTGDEISRSLRHYEVILRSWASQLLTGHDPLGQAVNFLPVVTDLYNAPDGCVVSLGHSTASASIKDERMRRRSTDLREEPFHLGGLAGVNNLTSLYSISKTWDGTYPFARPGVYVPGHFSCVGNLASRVEHVLVSGCACKNDFRLVMSHLA